MDIEIVSPLRGAKRKICHAFLRDAGLEPDEAVEQTVLVWDEDALIATGSRQENLLKCIAVAPSRQGEGLLATVLTTLRQEAFRAGQRHLFLYTKPQNGELFLPLLFYPVAQTQQVLLMEDKRQGIENFLKNISGEKPAGRIGAAVMNCDPFTLGHQYLISKAAESCDRLYVFVLSEDKGGFSATDRMEMVKRGTAHLQNVTVLPTGPYLISAATFPTYFLKERDKADEIQCMLDIEIFAGHFAPAFGITQRYVGSEPLSPLTDRYNKLLQANLPCRGIGVVEIPRLETKGRPVSASAVRKAIAEGNWDAVASLVPKTTLDYLQNR